MPQVILDTNLYVSYYIDRNPEQYKIARSYIEQLVAEKVEIILPTLILGEVVYILEKAYDLNPMQICELLLPLISQKHLILEQKEVYFNCFKIFENQDLDFADCLLLALQQTTKAKLVTFDKKLKKHG